MQTQQEEHEAYLNWQAHLRDFEREEPVEVVRIARLISNNLGWQSYVWTDNRRPHITVMSALFKAARAVLKDGES